MSLRNVPQGTTIWAIVRSLKHQKPGMIQVKDLSPSKELFHKYLSLKAVGRWNEATFKEIYVPRFLYEIRSNKKAIDLLNEIYKIDKAGGDIALVCFCHEEDKCHRSIIAGLLQAVGCNVKTLTGNDYAAYHEMFKNTDITKPCPL